MVNRVFQSLRLPNIQTEVQTNIITRSFKNNLKACCSCKIIIAPHVLLQGHSTALHSEQLNPVCGSYKRFNVQTFLMEKQTLRATEFLFYLTEKSSFTLYKSTWLTGHSQLISLHFAVNERTYRIVRSDELSPLATHCTFLRLKYAGFHHSSKTAECFAFSPLMATYQCRRCASEAEKMHPTGVAECFVLWPQCWICRLPTGRMLTIPDFEARKN